MASNQTFQKRQKEMRRKEKQLAKAERKAQRKIEKESAQPEGDTAAAPVPTEE